MSQIIILDAGGQYCHLLARRIRELGVESQIKPLDTNLDVLAAADGLIISGGPKSVLEPHAPRLRPEGFELGVPILGVCYGHQLLANSMAGGKVTRGAAREYGPAELRLKHEHLNSIFQGVPEKSQVWMSHGDSVTTLPTGFEVLATTPDCSVAAMGDTSRRIFGVQFHPEVTHTAYGRQVLENFVKDVCGCQDAWKPASDSTISRLKRDIAAAGGETKKILFFVSGGVDSTVAFKLCVDAIGASRMHGVFVDTGFLRLNEAADVMTAFAKAGLTNVEKVDASDRFLEAVKHLVEPENKRKAIGSTFLDIEAACLSRFPSGEWLLGQGTIYPDTIESGGTADAALIKTHHNRVPEILERIARGEIVEPLREFYKDEVRDIGRALGLPSELIGKHPFPGPGLAVRHICCDCSGEWIENPELCRIAEAHGYGARELPIKVVGVQGDERTYAYVAVLEGPHDLSRAAIASRAITNTVSNVNRVALWLGGTSAPGSFTLEPAYLSKDRLDLLRSADDVARRVLDGSPFAGSIWQCPVILLPLQCDGKCAVAVRPVQSHDGMTAQFVRVSEAVLRELASSLLQVRGIGAVLYDVTDKPPATIEWE